jgi:hypothetical protein
MIETYDFIFTPGMTNPYIPSELLQSDQLSYDSSSSAISSQKSSTNSKRSSRDDTNMINEDDIEASWRPFRDGGYLDLDRKELRGFDDDYENRLLTNINEDDDVENDENLNDLLFYDDDDDDDDDISDDE